jgi:hypothetical protein
VVVSIHGQPAEESAAGERRAHTGEEEGCLGPPGGRVRAAHPAPRSCPGALSAAARASRRGRGEPFRGAQCPRHGVRGQVLWKARRHRVRLSAVREAVAAVADVGGQAWVSPGERELGPLGPPGPPHSRGHAFPRLGLHNVLHNGLLGSRCSDTDRRTVGQGGESSWSRWINNSYQGEIMLQEPPDPLTP